MPLARSCFAFSLSLAACLLVSTFASTSAAQTPPIAVASEAPEAPPAPAAAETPPASAETPADGAAKAPAAAATAARPLVTIEGQRGYLESRATSKRGGDDDWQFVCQLPCQRKLDPSLEYQISGLSAVDSNPFRLPTSRSQVRVDADVGSMPARVTGIVLMPVGGVGIAFGLGGALLSSMFGNEDGLRLSAAIGGGGALVLATGVVLVASNATKVKIDPAGVPTLPLAKGVSLTPRGLTF